MICLLFRVYWLLMPIETLIHISGNKLIRDVLFAFVFGCAFWIVVGVGLSISIMS